MKRATVWTVAVGLVAAAVTGLIIAQDKSDTKAPSADEAAIKETAIAFARAFEKGDAKAVAAFWTEEGEYQDEDSPPIKGRAALEKAYTDFFSKRAEVKTEGKIDSIRFVGKGTAIADGTFTVKSKDGPTITSQFSAVYTNTEGKWLMALLKEWSDADTEDANIADLAWLIGTWEGTGEEAKARTTYEWNDTKTFIKCTYSITKVKDGTVIGSGTQVIGVDPADGFIHGWLFDSTGGVGESVWFWDGERWVIESIGTLSDGIATTATNLLKRGGDDEFTWRSVERTLDEKAQPDIGPVKAKRVKGQ